MLKITIIKSRCYHFRTHDAARFQLRRVNVQKLVLRCVAKKKRAEDLEKKRIQFLGFRGNQNCIIRSNKILCEGERTRKKKDISLITARYKKAIYLKRASFIRLFTARSSLHLMTGTKYYFDILSERHVPGHGNSGKVIFNVVPHPNFRGPE